MILLTIGEIADICGEAWSTVRSRALRYGVAVTHVDGDWHAYIDVAAYIDGLRSDERQTLMASQLRIMTGPDRLARYVPRFATRLTVVS